MIRYSDDDRRRMRAEAAEQAEINAELMRLLHRYARTARRPASAAEVERERRLTRVRENLQIRPHRVTNRDVKMNARMRMLDIRPWTARPGEEH